MKSVGWCSKLCAASCALVLTASAFGASAQAADGGAAPVDTSLGNHQKHIRMDAGARTQFVNSRALDAFASNDVIAQLSLAASLDFWARDRLSLAAGLGFDYGGRSASARSGEASLDLRRFSLTPELRYHVLRVLAVTAKVGPTLTREKAMLAGGGLGSDQSKTAWKVGVDATAGAALEVFGFASGKSNKPRLWLTAEGGYGWTAPNRLVLEPSESSSAPQRLTPLDLGELSLSGPLFRITAALSFW
jgi:hypothetical protein